jgi:DNA modification methylase
MLDVSVDKASSTLLEVPHERLCDCTESALSCMPAKEWMKCQLGVWRFSYEGRDLRNKKVHPATFPISLAARVISLMTHTGELILDPFVGSGTTLIAAQDLERNAVGFDLHPQYVDLTEKRLISSHRSPLFSVGQRRAICDDARSIDRYLLPQTVKLILTSPPYANLLNRARLNKSRRTEDRQNDQYMQVEQYSQDRRDLGTLAVDDYSREMQDIFAKLLPLLKPGGHCVIDVPDMWWRDERVTLHIVIVEALRRAGYELRNIVIWDRTNIVNRVGIFGWPSNYITMGTTFEYLLDFRRPF